MTKTKVARLFSPQAVHRLRAVLVLLLGTFAMAGMTGCASALQANSPSPPPWHDTVFELNQAQDLVTSDDLFRLDPELIQKLKAPGAAGLTRPQQLNFLFSILNRHKVGRFGYSAGHSTTASQTWQQQHGDCISLSILVYSMARLLGMEPEIQEVRVAPIFDRRGNMDYLNLHVNVLFPRSGPIQQVEGRMTPADMVLDFEPQTQVAAALKRQCLTLDNIAT